MPTRALRRFGTPIRNGSPRMAAQKAFIVTVERGVDPEALIAGARRYAIERAEEDPRYTEYPATWLNGGCWTDEASGPPVLDNDGNVIAFAAAARRRIGRSRPVCWPRRATPMALLK